MFLDFSTSEKNGNGINTNYLFILYDIQTIRGNKFYVLHNLFILSCPPSWGKGIVNDPSIVAGEHFIESA